MKISNVIIVTDFAAVEGGASKVAIESALGLARMGVAVTMLCAVGPEDPRLADGGVRVVCLGQSDILRDPNRLRAVRQGWWNGKARRALAGLLRGHSPADTVVHIHLWAKALSPSVFAAVAATPFQVVVTLHDYFLLCPNGGLYDYQRQRICDVEPGSLRCLLTNCDARNYPQKVWRWVRQSVLGRTLAGMRNLIIIYISETGRRAAMPQLGRLTDRWHFVQNPAVISSAEPVDVAGNHDYLFMARLSPEKGADLFCRAIEELGLRGVVVGDGQMRGELERSHPGVEFTGWLIGQAKADAVGRCRCLVFPSRWYEGMPLAILEMQSRGVPCVVPDRCAASERVAEGETGFVFRTGDLDSLKAAIMRCEAADLAAMQPRILAAAHPEACTIEAHCRRLVEVYDDVLTVSTARTHRGGVKRFDITAAVGGWRAAA